MPQKSEDMKTIELLKKVADRTATSSEYRICFLRCDRLLGFTPLRNKLVLGQLDRTGLHDVFNMVVYYK